MHTYSHPITLKIDNSLCECIEICTCTSLMICGCFNHTVHKCINSGGTGIQFYGEVCVLWSA